MNTVVPTPDALPAGVPESFWRSLLHLNYFRLFLAFALGVTSLWASDTFYRLQHPGLFTLICAVYFLAAWLFLRPMVRRSEAFERQVVRQVMVDIVCLGLLLHLSGGNASSLGLLLIVTVAAVGMLKENRLVLFWAAAASVVVLGEQAVQILGFQAGAAGFLRAGLLSLGLFGVATLSHALAMGTLAADRLARERGKQAESLARINERMIQELPYAVMAVNGEGEVLQYNARMEALLGTQFFSHCTLSHCAPQLAELWEAWRAGGKLPRHPFQEGKDGRRLRPRFIELEPTRSAGAVVVLEDLTELEQRAQKMKLASLGMLTANLAHEIRNPLSAIRHAAGLLKEDARDAVSTKLTRIIDDNAQRLNSLVEDVLALNRRDRMNRENIALAAAVPGYILQFTQREQVPEEVIQLQIAGDPLILMDPGHLEQILWNLLRNAWRYCQKGRGSIRVRLAAFAGRVDLDVFNDGPPIPGEIQARLFEPFYTTDKQGTGLGLYIARELAEANHASLRYIDNPDGVLFRLSCQAPPSSEGNL